MRKPSGQTLILGAVVAGSFALVGYLFLNHERNAPPQETEDEFPQAEAIQHVAAPCGQLTLENIPFNDGRSYEYLKQICDIGPRPSGSAGIAAQQKLLTEHFQKLGGRVTMQRFQIRHPQGGTKMVPMANMIVQWHPERKLRILLCAHYDTRPFPDSDKRNPRGTFIGANDGGSGTALLMEMAHEMPKLTGKYGVDFVLFDAEEFIFVSRNPLVGQQGKYFVGSQYFADQYADRPPKHRYAAGILLDMVADADLQISYEKSGMRDPNTKKLMIDIWGVAAQLGVRRFIRRARHEIKDDHLPLIRTAKIPTCDIIDFDYPNPSKGNIYWHTEADTIDKCSALSLAKVGYVVHSWLKAINR
jgi:hypothetical protein